VILHYHIYKNAGTTVEAVLEREFGLFFATIEGGGATGALTNAELLAFLESHDTLLAISSHQIRYPRPASDRFEFFDICFIRHPLDRLFSHYSFLRKPQVTDPLTDAARTMDLAGFCSFLLERHPEYTDNPQTALLLHRGDTSSVSTADARAARSLVREISVLGVVEAFDESLMLAEYTLHPWFPHLRMHYVPQNVTNSADIGFEHRLDVIRSSCGEELYARLAAASELDLVLWREAQAELQRRLEARPEHEIWLEEFRRRTDRYQGGPRLRDRLLQRMHIPTARSVKVQRGDKAPASVG